MKRRVLQVAAGVVLAFLLVVGAVATNTFSKVREAATIDETATIDASVPADAIVVLGAAQYNGRPSPVFGARLDHAFDLFERGFANVIITTGGYGPDPNYSEAHVGARYLAAKGVDESQIVIEQGSGTTETTVRAVARHVHAHDWQRVIVVSDGFHLYRLRQMFADYDIDVITSPAPESRIEASDPQRFWFSVREVLGIWAYRIVRQLQGT